MPKVTRHPDYFVAVKSWFALQTEEDEPTELVKKAHADKVTALAEDDRDAYYEITGHIIRGKQKLDLKDRII